MDALVIPKIRERLAVQEMIDVRESFIAWTKATWARVENIKPPLTTPRAFYGDWEKAVGYNRWRFDDLLIQSLWKRWVHLEGYDY